MWSCYMIFQKTPEFTDILLVLCCVNATSEVSTPSTLRAFLSSLNLVIRQNMMNGAFGR